MDFLYTQIYLKILTSEPLVLFLWFAYNSLIAIYFSRKRILSKEEVVCSESKFGFKRKFDDFLEGLYLYIFEKINNKFLFYIVISLFTFLILSIILFICTVLIDLFINLFFMSFF